jgi:hypothetical protein
LNQNKNNNDDKELENEYTLEELKKMFEETPEQKLKRKKVIKSVMETFFNSSEK